MGVASIVAAATLVWAAEWHAPDPPPPPYVPPTALEQAVTDPPQFIDAVGHIYCTLSVVDPRDGFEACLHTDGFMPGMHGGPADDLTAVKQAEEKTRPGECVLAVHAHFDPSKLICVGWK